MSLCRCSDHRVLRTLLTSSFPIVSLRHDFSLVLPSAKVLPRPLASLPLLCYHPPVPIRRRAKAITIINLKGGVGKTHTTWLLAGVCQERGLKCLAVDLDQQGNLTRNLVDGQPTAGAEKLFAPGCDIEPEDIICRSVLSNIDLIPAGPLLQPLDLTDQNQWERSDLQFALVDLVHAVRSDYDYILLDCPTKLSLTAFAALTASDFAVVPLEPADWGAQGVSQVTEAIQYVRKRHNPKLALLGYLISRMKRRRKYHQIYASELRSTYGDLAFDVVIQDLAGFEQAVTHAIPVNIRRRNSKEATIARDVFDEVERRITKARARGRTRRRASISQEGLVAVS